MVDRPRILQGGSSRHIVSRPRGDLFRESWREMDRPCSSKRRKCSTIVAFLQRIAKAPRRCVKAAPVTLHFCITSTEFLPFVCNIRHPFRIGKCPMAFNPNSIAIILYYFSDSYEYIGEIRMRCSSEGHDVCLYEKHY